MPVLCFSWNPYLRTHGTAIKEAHSDDGGYYAVSHLKSSLQEKNKAYCKMGKPMNICLLLCGWEFLMRVAEWFLCVFSVDLISPSLACVFCIILTLPFESSTSWYASQYFLYGTEENFYVLPGTHGAIICIFLLFASAKRARYLHWESLTQTFLEKHCLWNTACSSGRLLCAGQIKVFFKKRCTSLISSFSHLL